MAIGNVVQRGAIIYIYDENNRQINSVPAGNGPNDGLKGYTSTRINVQRALLFILMMNTATKWALYLLDNDTIL